MKTAAWMAALSCACAAPARAAAQNGPPPRELPPETRLAVRYHGEHLNHPSEASLRALGARFLLEMRLPEATAVLDQGLRGGNLDVIIAVVDSIGASGIAPPELIDALALALNTMPSEHTERIAQALALYGERGSQKVAELALDASHNHQVRLGAVQALGELRNPETVRNSVDALIQLIQRAETEPPDIINAGFEALDQLTSLSRFGRDVKAWTDWWLRTREKPLSEWLPDEFQRMSDQRDALQRQLNEARGENEIIRTKLEELMGEVYFLLRDKSQPEMNAKLAVWLGDRAPAVRRIALSRVESRAGNGEMPSPEVTTALVDRLKDADADLRRRSARLLDRVRHEQIGTLVAEALAVETNLETRLAFLEILRNQPTSAAVPTLLTLMVDVATRDAAAAALNEVVRAGRLPEDYRQSVLDAARQLFNASRTVPTVRLMAAIGEQTDIENIIPLLDESAVDVRSAAAESLRPVPAAEAALLAHAGDPAVFPWVVDMLASGPATAQHFNTLLGLSPPDAALRQRWREGLLRLGSRMPPSEVAAIDAALTAAPAERLPPPEAAALREQIHTAVLALPPDAMPIEQRQSLLRTVARLRSDLNQPQATIDALDRLLTINGNGSASTNGPGPTPAPPLESPELRSLRFLSLARLRQFDQAALIEPDAAPWLATLEAIIESDPELAALMRDQIELRYGQGLTAEQRTQLDVLAARLPRHEPPVDGGEGDGGGGGTSDDQTGGGGDGGGRSLP